MVAVCSVIAGMHTARLAEAEGRSSECVYCHDVLDPAADLEHWEACEKHPARARLADAEALLREASECEGVVSGCYALSAGLRKRIQAAVAKGVRDE